jgi:uncharacterized membrane protein
VNRTEKSLKKILRKLTFMPETVLYIISHIQLDNFSVIPELESGKILFCFLVVDTSWKFIH